MVHDPLTRILVWVSKPCVVVLVSDSGSIHDYLVIKE
jgi:hypothetical protein